MAIISYKGEPVHRGSWGSPDVGLTEAFSDLLGQPRGPQGGSNLVGSSSGFSGTGATGEWPAPQPQPYQQTSQPVYQPTPQQPAPTGGGYTPGQGKYAGWGAAEEAADRAALGTSGQVGGGGQQDIMRQIDEMYNLSISGLNKLYSQIKTESLPTTLQGLEVQRGQLSRQLDTSQQAAAKEFASQQTEAEAYKQSAMSEATQAYQALQQQGHARFGAGTSTGPAIMELAQREYFKTSGSINKAWNTTVGKIFSERTRLFKYVEDKRIEVQESFAQKTREVNDDFSRQLIAVEVEKGMVEQAKTAAKLNVLQETIRRTKDIRDAMAIAESNLEIWKQQVDYESDRALTWVNSEVQNAFTDPNYIRSKQGIQFQPLPSSSWNQQQQQQQARQQQFLAGRPEESDMFQSLVNPFA